MKLALNTSIKQHVIIALLTSVWLVLFLVLIAPFDTGDLSMPIRIRILPFYGVLSFVVYLIMILIQNKFYAHYKKWSWISEVLFLFLYVFILTFCCYAYYKTDIINGTYNFKTFVLEVYIPIALILLPFVVILRWFFNKSVPHKQEKTITLKGNNKLDILKVFPEDIICVSSADNYVEINYLIKGELHKKLLRNTLKGIQSDIPGLLKVHRSHLINPTHFKEWNGSNSIKLTEVEVPVSKNYKTSILELI